MRNTFIIYNSHIFKGRNVWLRTMAEWQLLIRNRVSIYKLKPMVCGHRRSFLLLYARKVLYKLQKLYTCNLCKGKVTCVKIKKAAKHLSLSGTLLRFISIVLSCISFFSPSVSRTLLNMSGASQHCDRYAWTWVFTLDGFYFCIRICFLYAPQIIEHHLLQ